jgi:hypothetical protein
MRGRGGEKIVEKEGKRLGKGAGEQGRRKGR